MHALPKLAIALALVLAPLTASADGPWEGRWTTNWSDINFLQQDNLVYGEYVSAGGGYMIGLLDPSGKVFRGTWVQNNSSTWGGLEFRINADSSAFTGAWTTGSAYFNFDGSSDWSGQRADLTPVFTDGFDPSYAWPEAYDFDDPATTTYLVGGPLPN